MRNESKSLYEILRVPRDASPEQVERAYRRIKAEQQKETVPPDPRLRVLLEHAHDVLMDPVRREAYDKDWFSPIAQVDRVRRSPAKVAAIAAAFAAIGAAAWMSLRPPDEVETRPRKEIEQSVAMAVGRVTRIDLTGANASLGVAFAIAEETLVTSCEGLSPKDEVVVRFGKRTAPVRVTAIDEASGVCKLTGGTVGSWPLALARGTPAHGHLVYLVAIGLNHEPKLLESHYRGATSAGSVRMFEAERALTTADLGSPLLDRDGRVVGAASRVAGKAGFVPVPRSWLAAPPAAPAPPQPAQAEPSTSSEPKPPPPMPGPAISPERKERLEKAFRPPIQVPDDL